MSNSQFVCAVVVAAGQGTRIGFKKQFATLAGEPIWLRSTEALFTGGMDFVCIVVPQEDVADVADKVATQPWAANAAVVAGGGTRAESVRCGLDGVRFAALGSATAMSLSDESMRHWIVLVHDAARPFVATEDVCAIALAARTYGAAILASPCKDTVKSVDRELRVEHTIPRESLWLAQTPQAFRWPLLVDAYAAWDAAHAPTDEATVVEAAGISVRVVPSTGVNFKITTAEDLSCAEWYAQKRWGEERRTDARSSGIG